MIEPTEIHAFASQQHFRAFQQLLEDAVEAGDVSRVDVGDRYGSQMFQEEWYRLTSGDVWRLVSPDFPFKGVFLRVTPGV
jgi:hypothetical protein